MMRKISKIYSMTAITYELVGTLNTFSEKGYAKLVDDTENRDDYFMKAAWDATPLMRTDSLDLWSSPTGRELVRIPYDDARPETF